MKRNRPLVIGLASIVTVLLPSFADSAETLGRLFFTPERRAALERQRQYSVQEAEALQGESVSLDGVVKRSSGRSTIWVNGRAQHDVGNGTGIANGEQPALSLRVGESANRTTGEKKDGLGGGTIVIKRRSTSP
jgi:hypothetical protein